MTIKRGELEVVDISKEDIMEKIKALPRVKGIELDLEINKGKIDEIEVSRVTGSIRKTYEVTIPTPSGAVYVVLVSTPKDCNPAIVLEKYSNAVREEDFIEADIKVIGIMQNMIRKILDGRYKINKIPKDPDALAEKIKTEGLPPVLMQRVK